MTDQAGFQHIDTHCHLDLYADRDGAIARARAAGTAIVAVSNRASEFRDMSMLYGGQPGIFLGIGFHPEAAGGSTEAIELAIFERELPKARWIAEIGLDGVIANSVGPYFGSVPSLKDQQRVLERILALPLGDRPMSLHSRGAAMTLLDMLVGAKIGKAIFHWFHGTLDEARRILDQGYFLSVNPRMVDGSDLHGIELVKWLPEDRLLIETDGPFVLWRGGRAEPASAGEIASRLAELRSADPAALVDRIRANFRALTGM
jgi:TatD DNase family protein